MGADTTDGASEGAPRAARDVVVTDAAVSDMDYLRARMRRGLGRDDEDAGDASSSRSSMDREQRDGGGSAGGRAEGGWAGDGVMEPHSREDDERGQHERDAERQMSHGEAGPRHAGTVAVQCFAGLLDCYGSQRACSAASPHMFNFDRSGFAVLAPAQQRSCPPHDTGHVNVGPACDQHRPVNCICFSCKPAGPRFQGMLTFL